MSQTPEASEAQASLKAFQHLFYKVAFCPESYLESLLKPETPETLWLKALPKPILPQYRWMVYSNHAETLESIYPYTFSLIKAYSQQAHLKTNWQTLVKDYLRAFPPEDYHLYGTACAFVEFLGQQTVYTNAFAFLEDLAAYELLEAEVLRLPDSTNETIFSPDFEAGFNFEALTPVINPAAKAFSSSYPLEAVVALLKTKREGLTPADIKQLKAYGATHQPLWLWVYRDEACACRFFKVMPPVQSFLALALAHGQAKTPMPSYQTLLTQALEPFGMAFSPEIAAQVLPTLAQLQQAGILLGSQPAGLR